MIIDDKIRDKNHNTVIIKKKQNHQHYHQVKLINIDILQVKKYYLLVNVK